MKNKLLPVYNSSVQTHVALVQIKDSHDAYAPRVFTQMRLMDEISTERHGRTIAFDLLYLKRRNILTFLGASSAMAARVYSGWHVAFRQCLVARSDSSGRKSPTSSYRFWTSNHRKMIQLWLDYINVPSTLLFYVHLKADLDNFQ